MKYYRGQFFNPARETEKAIAFNFTRSPQTGVGDELKWFPKSQLIISEPNEVGWKEIMIPIWLIRNNGMRMYDVQFQEIVTYDGMDEIINI